MKNRSVVVVVMVASVLGIPTFLAGMNLGSSFDNTRHFKGKRVTASFEVTAKNQKFGDLAKGNIESFLHYVEATLSVAEECEDEELSKELFSDLSQAMIKLGKEAIAKIEKKVKQKSSGGSSTKSA